MGPSPFSSTSLLELTATGNFPSATLVQTVTQVYTHTLQIIEISPGQFSLEALSATETLPTSSKDLNDFTEVVTTWVYELLPDLGQPTAEPASTTTPVNTATASPMTSIPNTIISPTATVPTTAETNSSSKATLKITKPASAPVVIVSSLSATSNVLPNGLSYGIVVTPSSSSPTTTPAKSTLCFDKQLQVDLPCSVWSAILPQSTTSDAIRTIQELKGHRLAVALPLLVFSVHFNGLVDADDWFTVISLIIWCCQLKVINNIFGFIQWTNHESWGVVYAILIALTFRLTLLGLNVGVETLLIIYAFLQCVSWVLALVGAALTWVQAGTVMIRARLEALLGEALELD